VKKGERVCHKMQEIIGTITGFRNGRIVIAWDNPQKTDDLTMRAMWYDMLDRTFGTNELLRVEP
jgi:hypothetical protein